MNAYSGFKMAAQNSKWLLCDVIVTSSLNVTIETSEAQSVKLMTCLKRAKFHHKSVNTFRDIRGGTLCPLPLRLGNSKKSPGKIGLRIPLAHAPSGSKINSRFSCSVLFSRRKLWTRVTLDELLCGCFTLVAWGIHVKRNSLLVLTAQIHVKIPSCILSNLKDIGVYFWNETSAKIWSCEFNTADYASQLTFLIYTFSLRVNAC